MSRHNLAGTFLVIALLAALSGCQGSAEDKEKENTAKAAPVKRDINRIKLTKNQLGTIGADLVSLESRVLEPIIYANGVITLLPDSKAEVSSHISGKIEQIYVREGQGVRKGQPLVKLSSFALLELQNDYAAAASDAEYLQAEFKRQDELRKSNIGVLADYQAIDAKLKAAIARRTVLKSKLSLLGVKAGLALEGHPTNIVIIHAPIDGFVYKFHENIGATIQPETLLAEVIDANRVQADVFVYEKDANYVREGQAVELSFVNHTLAPVKGTVKYISRSIDNENGAITLHVVFERPKNSPMLLADMTVQARLVGSGKRESKNTLPRTAILDDGTDKYVFATSENKGDTMTFHRVKVELLSQGEKYVEVRPVDNLTSAMKIANNNVLAIEAERKKNE
jgi:membrane fusion protein, heavy metal efflux system